MARTAPLADVAENGASAAPSSAPVRDLVLDGRGDADARDAALAAFLAEQDGEAALRLWFGQGRPAFGPRLRLRLDADVARLDEVLSRGVDVVLHHPRFQGLESAWRGVAWLLEQAGVGSATVVRLFDARWSELAREFDRSPDFDSGVLFQRVYEDEFGTPGGLPLSMIVGLYEVTHRPGPGRPIDDVAVVRHLARVAAAAFCPIVLAASPVMFGVDALGELDLKQSVGADLRAASHARLRTFQETPESRFIALAAPRMLIRRPWTGRSAGDCGFRYEEGLGRPLWGPASLALGAVCVRAFEEHHWLAAIRGVLTDEATGGLVPELAPDDFPTDRAGVAPKLPLELELSDTLERELVEAGVLCLRRCKHTPFAAFYNLPSAHRPKGAYLSDAANANERLGAMLNYVLCVSRFAHYIKVIARDWIGSIVSAEDCEARLQSWVNRFTASGDDLSYDLRARYPLQAAQVRVRERPGQPGAYSCTALLKPHFQLDQALSEFQLVTVIGDTAHRL